MWSFSIAAYASAAATLTAKVYLNSSGTAILTSDSVSIGNDNSTITLRAVRSGEVISLTGSDRLRVELVALPDTTANVTVFTNWSTSEIY